MCPSTLQLQPSSHPDSSDCLSMWASWTDGSIAIIACQPLTPPFPSPAPFNRDDLTLLYRLEVDLGTPHGFRLAYPAQECSKLVQLTPDSQRDTESLLCSYSEWRRQQQQLHLVQ